MYLGASDCGVCRYLARVSTEGVRKPYLCLRATMKWSINTSESGLPHSAPGIMEAREGAEAPHSSRPVPLPYPARPSHLPRFPLSFVFRSLDLDLDLERDLDLLAIGLLFRVLADGPHEPGKPAAAQLANVLLSPCVCCLRVARYSCAAPVTESEAQLAPTHTIAAHIRSPRICRSVYSASFGILLVSWLSVCFLSQ